VGWKMEIAGFSETSATQPISHGIITQEWKDHWLQTAVKA
jgi:hypothetical protein